MIDLSSSLHDTKPVRASEQLEYQTDDPRFATLGERVLMLARKAASLAERLHSR